jgi:hypothetical protein
LRGHLKAHSCELGEGQKLTADILLNMETMRIHRGGDGKKPPGAHEHHIVPRSLKGHITSKDNLIDLSPEDHFLVHVALSAFFDHKLLCKQATHLMASGCGMKWTKDNYKKVLEKARAADPLVKKVGKAISESNAGHGEFMKEFNKGNTYGSANKGFQGRLGILKNDNPSNPRQEDS